MRGDAFHHGDDTSPPRLDRPGAWLTGPPRQLDFAGPAREMPGAGGRVVLRLDGAWSARLFAADQLRPLGPELFLETYEPVPIDVVAWSRDGKTVLTSGRVVTRRGDAARAEPMGEAIRARTGVERATFSPDDKLVLTVGRGVARFWDARTGQPVGEPILSVSDLSFSPDGRWLLGRVAGGDD